MFKSVRFRLIAWFLGVFSLLFLILSLFLYHKLETIVIGSVDSHLHYEVQLLSSLIKAEGGRIDIELSEAETGDYSIPLSGHYYQVVSSDGNVLALSPSLSIVDAYLPIPPVSFEPVNTTIIGPGKGILRLHNQSFKLSNDIIISIQASESLEEAYNLLRLFRDTILIVLPVVFLLSGAGIFIITTLSLKPLNLFSDKIGRITERNLNERVDMEGIAHEIKPLAMNFNTMITRLENSFLRQRLFLSDASHEIRTPVSVIKSYCDVMIGKERTIAEYQETLKKIGEMVDKMADTICRILEVSRLESKTFQLRLEELDLMEIMGDVVRLFESSASQQGIAVNLAGIHWTIKGDRERLMEAFANLVDNAIKYNRQGGRVDIHVGESGREVVVTVSDTGGGIPPDEREHIFERFYRLPEARDTVRGSGLGLPIVKAIIHAHRGRIEVESEVGKGSRFVVFIPKG
ncbi:MAG: hypothetical protein HY878_05170 [Deltaproteobacteria bacterium]|nr:hypothetical protein [Deltaproteobacteria bacterium]